MLEEHGSIRKAAGFLAPRYCVADRYSSETLSSICKEIRACDQLEHMVGVDLGAGTCIPTGTLTKNRARMLAVDLSASMLSLSNGDVEVMRVVGDATAIPVRSSICGLVTIFSALHLITDKLRLVHEARRVLAVGGTFCVVYVDRDDLQDQLIHRGFPEFHEEEARKHVSEAELRQLCESLGLRAARLAVTFITRQMYASGDEYVSRIRQKPYFGLGMMSENAFTAGIERLTRYVDQHYPLQPVEDKLKVKLSIFRRGKEGSV